MTNLLFIDIKTFGLSDTQATFESVAEWAFIKEIAWIIYNEPGELIREENHTLETLEVKDSPLVEIMNKFNEDIVHFKPIIIGYNVEFDEKLISAILLKLNLPNQVLNQKTVCTMLQTVDFCNLPNKKIPTLNELHYKLFNEYFEGSQIALINAQITAKCYFELKKIGFSFREPENLILNPPENQQQREFEKQKFEEIYYKIAAFIELLDLCKTMPKQLSINEQLKFLNTHYFDTKLNRSAAINDANLSFEQIGFFKSKEKELLKALKLEEKNEKLLNDSKKMGITPLIGVSLVFATHFTRKYETEEDFKKIAIEYNSLTFLYELWMIGSQNKQKGEKQEAPSLTTKDLWERTRNQILRNEFNYEKIPNIPFFLWPSEDELVKYPALESQIVDSLNELEKTLIMMVPYLRINTAVALLYSVWYLDSLIKHLDKKYESRILSIRARLIKEIDEKPKSGCYIATSCYKDCNASEVAVFRIFRDTCLMKNYFGRAFVRQYYRCSPFVANALQKNTTVNSLVKILILSPICHLLKIKYNIARTQVKFFVTQ